MRESSKAGKAFNDYAALGEQRSLEKLAEVYQKRTENVPTRQLSRLKRWSQQHGWQARLGEIAEQERQAIVKRGIADKQFRVNTLNDLHGRMLKVIESRGEANTDLTGGDTGLVVREVTYLPSGATRERHEVDTGLLKSIQEYQKQAAQELGQWVEKIAPTDPTGKHEYADLTDEERANKLAELLERARARRAGQAASE